MQVDFDEKIDRTHTNSLKWDSMEKLYGVSAKDGLAMWVADMDFQAPEAVTKAIRGMAEKGIYGYAREDDNYRQAICDWMARRHK